MKSIDGYTPISGPGDPLHCSNTAIAVAIGTLGNQPHPVAGAQHLREEIGGVMKDVTIWTLAELSPCGRFRASELLRVWHDPLWLQQNATHPFAILCTQWKISRELINMMKTGGPWPWSRDEAASSNNCSTNTHFIAAALTLGIPLDTTEPLRRISANPDTFLWKLAPASPDEKILSEILAVRWTDTVWQSASPFEPLALCRSFWDNYKIALAHIRERGPIAVFKNASGRRAALITRHTSPEDCDRYLKAVKNGWKAGK